MDAQLANRFAVFESMDELDPRAVQIAKNVFSQIDTDGLLTDDDAGMLVSHLIMALARSLKGDTSVENPPYMAFDEVSKRAPAAEVEARELCATLRDQEGLVLPEAETRYIAIHLAALDLRSHRSRKDSK